MTDLIRPSATGAGKTLVAVATYNEIESLPLLVEEIFRYAPDVDVLVVDDNSPDGTGAWCDERGAADARVRCLHRSGKLGLGTALVEGWQYAIAHGYHSVINLDADFSHHPRHLPELRAGVADGVDPPVEVMIGSRYVPGGRIERWPWYRRGTSRAESLCPLAVGFAGAQTVAGRIAATASTPCDASIGPVCGHRDTPFSRRSSGT